MINPENTSVFYENVRNNQIGDTDGISEEVAADIGFHSPEQLANLPELPEVKPSSESAVAAAEERGIGMARRYMKNPDAFEFGSDWPTVKLNRRPAAASEAVKQAREKLNPRTSSAIGRSAIDATKRYTDGREQILGNK